MKRSSFMNEQLIGISPTYDDEDDKERWPFFGGLLRGFGGGAKAGGVRRAFEQTCSGMNSAWWQRR